ncbi:protoporphyrinogen oxidase [Flammeovirga pacifica]|uniref:Coproporphyrinogen III oxidase n=1 Tax=Flammeovirga pacifica TaxID=915059 RepID=A0A1S1YWS1_FLAPC|nr:protoporphyrinogen oxidase [Flammeovirga pacifica]OHX65461.1 protoporphyrinogen oxidase [Flammeovirga pacifica]
MKIGIVGGGISGLTTAFYLNKKGYDCTVFEKNDIAGGCISTDHIDGRIFENGPNSLLFSSKHIQFIEEVGFKDQLIEAEEVNKDRYILKNGKYHVLPSGPQNFFTNKFFSGKTKWKIMTEYFRKNTPVEETETVYDFFLRRFNQEICDYALDPFVSGIYAGDPGKLAIKASFPSLYEAEKNYGSIIKGMIKKKKENKNSGSTTERRTAYSFKNGNFSFVQKLINQLNVKTGFEVASIEKQKDKFIIENSQEKFEFDQVIIASDAFSSINILKKITPNVAHQLEQIPSPPMCVVHSVYSKEAVKNAPVGFGGLNPKLENSFTSGSIWTSCIFPNRTNAKESMITTFVGGMQNIDKTELPEEIIKENVAKELKTTLNISYPPIYQKVFKWDKAIPQYTKEILDLWEAIKSERLEGLHFTTNWSGGIAVPDCIDQAIKLTENFEALNS